jgi:periplasmic nitrate reductase NapE
MREVMTQERREAAASVNVPPTKTRRRELLAFLILAFGIWPVVAVAVVGGYGFLVWMYQIVFGPPGPPGG